MVYAIRTQFAVVMAAAAVILGSYGPAVSAATTAQPTQPESILLSPTSKRYALKAGDTKTDSFKIVNDGSAPINFVVYARPYSVTNESYDPNFESDFKNADAYKWVQFKNPSYDLKPGQSVDVEYTLRVPASAAPGGHYGVLFAETQQGGGATGTAIAQKKRVGAILYTTVDGKLVTSGTLVGSKVPLFQFKAPLEIRQRIKNAGNSDFVVTSNTRVSDLFGGLKYKNDKVSTVLPATTRLIENDWVNPAWIGVYKVEQTAKFLDTSRVTTNYVLLIPIWVYLVLTLLIGARILYAVAQRNRKK